jgi:integrase
MAAHQNKDGSWTADYRDEYGQRKRTGGFATQDAAEAFAASQAASASKARAQARQLNKPETLLNLAEAIDLYLTSKAVRPSTLHTQTATFASLRRTIGDLPLSAITPPLLAAYFKDRAQRLAPTSVGFEKRMTKALFQFLITNGLTPHNPASTLRGTAPMVTTARALTRDEELELLTIASPHVLPRLLLALDAGLRLSEITYLRHNHLNLERQTLYVWSQKVYRSRTLPLTQRLTQVLEELQPRDPNARLFPLKRLASFLYEFRPKLGWHFRFHDLRHTFAKRLHDAGATQPMIAAALGHTWKTTTDIYTTTHITVDDLRPVVQRMEELAIAHSTAKLIEADAAQPIRDDQETP